MPLPTRVGGFRHDAYDGVEGLKRYIKAHNITLLIDATHPFAEQISHNAYLAAQNTHIPLWRIERSSWLPTREDEWHFFPHYEALIKALNQQENPRFFIATGKQNLHYFQNIKGQHIARIIDGHNIDEAHYPFIYFIYDKGPFEVENEMILFQQHHIQQLICKNAGGEDSKAKILAARALKIPVFMLERPILPPAICFQNSESLFKTLA